MKPLTPKEVNTFSKICSLKRDNTATKNSWMLLGGDGNPEHIIIVNQKLGESSTGSVVITKKAFERFIRFYETGSPIKSKTERLTEKQIKLIKQIS